MGRRTNRNDRPQINGLVPGSSLAMLLGLTAICLGVFVSSATAQDHQLGPAYGTATLTAGFQPDPHSINVIADGAHLAGPETDCEAYVADAPTFRLQYVAVDAPLVIASRRISLIGVNLRLLVRTPSGEWLCSGARPVLNISDPQSGPYAIWVGTRRPGSVEATLAFSETDNMDALLAALLVAVAVAVAVAGDDTPNPDNPNVGVAVELPPDEAARTIAAYPDADFTPPQPRPDICSVVNGERLCQRQQPLLTRDEVQIINTASVPLEFHVRPVGGSWSKYTLEPGHHQLLACRLPLCNASRLEVYVATSTGVYKHYPVEYTLRYELFWNTAEQLWDLRPLLMNQ